MCTYLNKENMNKKTKITGGALENGGNEVLLQPMGIIVITGTVILCVFYVPSVLGSIVKNPHV